MEILTVLLLAIGLSFDSFAVSVCSGLNLPQIRFFQAAKIALFLALFQAFMPLAGWLVGHSIKSLIEPVDHWIAFGLLSLIGGKMIIESFIGTEAREIKNPLHFRVILMLSLATSIDALAVGFSFATLTDKIMIAVFVIGSVTFIASMLGILLGKKTGPKINRFAEIAGGFILIGIGTKILIEHLIYHL
ncbi:MAG: manganese efflux pump MntP family protein [Prolixibacteraceae bacterium]|jgi:putative Mn2+ efflux pump MntP